MRLRLRGAMGAAGQGGEDLLGIAAGGEKTLTTTCFGKHTLGDPEPGWRGRLPCCIAQSSCSRGGPTPLSSLDRSSVLTQYTLIKLIIPRAVVKSFG